MSEFLDKLLGRQPKPKTQPQSDAWWVLDKKPKPQSSDNPGLAQGIPNQDVNVSGLEGQAQALGKEESHLYQVERQAEVLDAVEDTDMSGNPDQ